APKLASFRSRFALSLSIRAWLNIVEANEVDVLASTVLGDFEHVQDAEESGFTCKLWCDIREANRFDRIDLNGAFLHWVSTADEDMRPRPEADAAGDFAAADSVAKSFREDHLRLAARNANPNHLFVFKAEVNSCENKPFPGAFHMRSRELGTGLAVSPL